jgi:hypothetical protein
MENLLGVLPSILKPPKRHYIGLYALNECEGRGELLKIMVKLCLIPNANLLVVKSGTFGTHWKRLSS